MISMVPSNVIIFQMKNTVSDFLTNSISLTLGTAADGGNSHVVHKFVLYTSDGQSF